MDDRPPIDVVLASASPRRRELLGRLVEKRIIGELTIKPAEVDERPLLGEAPDGLASRLAAAKAAVVAARHPLFVVVGADTVVDVDGSTLGKPVDRSEAIAMLERLSGRRHEVHTGIAVHVPGTTMHLWVETTVVGFRRLTRHQIESYVDTGEPMDKAGAYGIQGGGGRLVESVEGSFDNVVGLPLDRLSALLESLALLLGGRWLDDGDAAHGGEPDTRSVDSE